MTDRVDDKELKAILRNLKAKSSGRTDGDCVRMTGQEIRGLVRVCEDLRDARDLMEKTAWLRPKAGKKRRRIVRGKS